jgi:hypothetical protein
MKRAIGHTMVATAVLAAVVFLTAPVAQAQVRFEGRFRLPHGNIAIGVGDPYYRSYFPVGSYVPYGYRVIRRPRYGYGFYHRSYWVPVRRYRTRWIVVAEPVFVERYDPRPYVYRDRYLDQGYRGDPYYDFNREYWDRSYHPYDDPNYPNR